MKHVLQIPPDIAALDQQLFEQVGNIDILTAITPTNLKEQRARFFESRFSINPEFSYKVEDINAFQKKRALYSLDIEQIADDDLRELYASVIESYVDKVDQYSSTGTPEFLYNSLRYFGEPHLKDMRNAQFILHLPDDEVQDSSSQVDAEQIVAAPCFISPALANSNNIDNLHQFIAHAIK